MYKRYLLHHYCSQCVCDIYLCVQNVLPKPRVKCIGKVWLEWGYVTTSLLAIPYQRISIWDL